MSAEIIKISKTNELTKPILFGSVCCFIIGLIIAFSPYYILSVAFFLTTIGLFTYGSRITIDFKGNSILEIPTIFYIPTIGKKTSFTNVQFDKASLSQFSDFASSRFRVGFITHTSQIQIREYHVLLTSSNSNMRLKLPPFTDYNYARKLILKLKNNWSYDIHDDIQEKLKSNRSGTKRR